MMARQRKEKAFRRRRHGRSMATNFGAADVEEVDGGSNEEENRVSDGEEEKE